MPININPKGTDGYQVDPHHSTVSPGSTVTFNVSVDGGVRVCFSDANFWNPSASYFDLPKGDTTQTTSTTPQCTGFGITSYGGTCPTVAGCTTFDDPDTISTSSVPGRHHGHHKK